MEKLSLREIAAALGCPLPPEAGITRVITDSREAGPGALFIALPGERVDGHDYINRALAATIPRPNGCCGSKAACGRFWKFPPCIAAKCRPG